MYFQWKVSFKKRKQTRATSGDANVVKLGLGIAVFRLEPGGVNISVPSSFVYIFARRLKLLNFLRWTLLKSSQLSTKMVSMT